MKMLNKFNTIFGIPEGTPFKRLEIEDWFIENLQDIKITKFVYNGTYYSVCIKEDWGVYQYSTDITGCKSIEDAFIDIILRKRRKQNNSKIFNFRQWIKNDC